MPLKLTVDSLKAEAAALQQLLDEAERTGDIVGKLQYKERLQEISSELKELADSDTYLANVAMFFSGKPVVGSRGIAADFAGKLLESYQDIVSKIFAESEVGVLGERGQVPLKQRADLMITGLTHGSFGFVLEELSDQTELHDTALKEVLTKVSDLLQHIGTENENDFESAVEDLDPRVLVALREFFKGLDTAGAQVRFVEDEREFSLDENAVHRGRVRTETTDIDERTEVISGVLIGFLPDHRKFELRDDVGTTIYGTVSKEAAEQFVRAVRYQTAVIGESCEAEFIVREVRPLNRAPKLNYRLVGFHKIGRSE